ncbi:hypothetical protein [Bacillus sp. Bos-x628]
MSKCYFLCTLYGVAVTAVSVAYINTSRQFDVLSSKRVEDITFPSVVTLS